MEKLITIHNQDRKIFGNLSIPKKGAPCIIIAHGLESSKDGNKWSVLSTNLYDAGFASLRFNFRGCGEGKEKSEGEFEDTTLTGRISDYIAAIDFLGNMGVDMSRLGVIGSSLGGMVAIAAGDKRMKVIVTVATPSHIASPAKQEFKHVRDGAYFRLDSGRRLRTDFFDDVNRYNICSEISKIQSPLLIIHGGNDELVPVQDTNELFRHANEPKHLEIVEGANHSFSSPENIDRLVNLSLKWFKSYL